MSQISSFPTYSSRKVATPRRRVLSLSTPPTECSSPASSTSSNPLALSTPRSIPNRLRKSTPPTPTTPVNASDTRKSESDSKSTTSQKMVNFFQSKIKKHAKSGPTLLSEVPLPNSISSFHDTVIIRSYALGTSEHTVVSPSTPSVPNVSVDVRRRVVQDVSGPLDQGPGTYASRSKSLVRKLSSRSRPRRPDFEDFITDTPPLSAGHKALRTLGTPVDDHTPSPVSGALSAFGVKQVDDHQLGRMTRSTASTARSKRMSLLQHSPNLSRFPQQNPGKTLVPFPGSPMTPATHRLNSPGYHHSNSPRASIKSTRRAEREWRARLAALSRTTPSPTKFGTPPSQIRGPVPPKRSTSKKPNDKPRLDVSTDSPEDARLVTPSHLGVVNMVALKDDESPSTPVRKNAFSFASQKSFATLGHHLLVPQSAGESATKEVERTPVHLRRTQASVAGSVVSRYEDDTPCKPRSILSQRPSLSALDITGENNETGLDPRYQGEDSPITPVTPKHLASLSSEPKPRFSPKCVDSESPVLPELEGIPQLDLGLVDIQWDLKLEPSASNKVFSNRRHDNSTISQPTINTDSVSQSTPRKDRTQSLPSSLQSVPPKSTRQQQRPSLTLDFIGTTRHRRAHTAQSSSQDSPNTLKTVLTSRSKTSNSNQTDKSGHTPYSPMTAFILSAPADGLWNVGFDDIDQGGGVESPRHRRGKGEITHPFAFPKSEIPPTPPSKSPYKTLATLPSHSVEASGIQDDVANRPSKTKSSEQNLTSPSPLPRKHLNILPVNINHKTTVPSTTTTGTTATTTATATATATASGKAMYGSSKSRIRPNKAKIEILGLSATGNGSATGRMKEGWEGLTPGLEDGNRPPKSGLPIDDLERWLQAMRLGS